MWRKGDLTVGVHHHPPDQPARDKDLTVVKPGKERKRGKGISLVNREKCSCGCLYSSVCSIFENSKGVIISNFSSTCMLLSNTLLRYEDIKGYGTCTFNYLAVCFND